VILVIEKKESKFVKFHAMQSIVTFLPLFIISMVGGFLPIIGPLISILAWIAGTCLWLILMFKAYQGEMFKLPIVGDFAEQQISRPPAGQQEQPSLPQQPLPQQPKMQQPKTQGGVFCPNCGKPIKPASSFCEECGAKIM
jgi:uncharacterized membrane protein